MLYSYMYFVTDIIFPTASKAANSSSNTHANMYHLAVGVSGGVLLLILIVCSTSLMILIVMKKRKQQSTHKQTPTHHMTTGQYSIQL